VLEFDAILCVSDPVAFGVIAACQRLGLHVPGDLAVTGFGNFEVAAISEPQITTVDVEARRIGEMTAATLCDIFSGAETMLKTEIRTSLVPGATT
jgi:LacI family gluconate utilization system Gnt-I transcriptional repressor